MKHLCLRDCYTGHRFYRKGDTCELPDDAKREKNFAPVDAVPTEKQREPNLGEYRCNKCLSIHRETSRLGKRHLKYKEE